MQRFGFAFDDRFRGFLRVVGVHEQNSDVVVGDGQFRARLGPMRMRTTLENISDTTVTRGYHWWKAIGPRVSVKDWGATFGTNTDAGLCVRFHDPVPILLGRARPHPGLTVTVADPDGLAAAILEERDRLDRG